MQSLLQSTDSFRLWIQGDQWVYVNPSVIKLVSNCLTSSSSIYWTWAIQGFKSPIEAYALGGEVVYALIKQLI